MLGIYNNVFKIGLIDLANVKVSGFLNSEGKIIDLNLNGLGIFGKNCYSSDNLVEALQSQDSKLTSEIFDLSDEKKNYDNSISVIKKTWKSSYFKIFLDSSDYKKNHIRGILNFENSEDILRTSLSIKSDDHIPEIINDIHFPYGLLLDYSYTDSTEDKPMSFKGIMNFMGVDSQGQFNLHSWNNTAKANIILPTIKMGNGNFEFITHDDLFYKYGLKDNSENFDSRSLDIHTGYSNLTSNNTLKFKLEKDSLSKSAILLEANMLIFGMVNRTITYLNKDLMSFSIIAHPFKGIFEANTTVEIKPTDHIENEDNSVVKIDFVHNDEYLNLEQTTNEYLQEWVSRIIKVTEKAKFLIEKYTQRLKTVSNSYTKENDCEVYEQWKELPTIVCDEYAQKATWVKEAVICTNMVQKCSLETNYCTRTNSKGEWQQSILKWDKWETVWEDKAPSKVCSEFHTENIPDNCLKMELVCSTTKEKDQEWVSKSKESEVLIQKIENDINDLVKFLSNAKQLRDSSVWALKNVKDKKSKKMKWKGCQHKRSNW